MEDKKDLDLTVKINYRGKSKEIGRNNLSSLDNLKNEIMEAFSIPNTKNYINFSIRNKDGKTNLIKEINDLFKYTNYLELDLNIDNELNKIIQFMKSDQFDDSNNNKIINNNEEIGSVKKEKENIEEVKKLKIEELQNQINEIKKGREQKKKIKEMNNKLCQYFENITKIKMKFDELKINKYINEIQNKIMNDIIPLIEKNIKRNQNKFIEIYMKQNDEKILKLNNYFEEISKDIDEIKKEINILNKNNAKNESMELKNNIRDNDSQQNENINNEKCVFAVNKKDKKFSIRIKRKDDNSSKQKNDSNIILDEFNIILEEIFYNDLRDLSNEEINKIKDCIYKLKSLKIEPQPIVQKFLDSNIPFFNKDIVNKNKIEEKFRNLRNIIEKIISSNEEEEIINKDNIKKNESKRNIYKRKKFKKDV